ncbi:hypothetical protein CSB66_0016 [Enterobacter hormaechei]|nr:hypothetical protein CSB66_0016 [Enterobacter hormaechei]
MKTATQSGQAWRGYERALRVLRLDKSGIPKKLMLISVLRV